MKKSIFTAVLAIVLTFGFAGAIIAQDETFKDVNVAYSFGLPDAKWKLTVKPSATSPNVEYVFGDRIEGHLEVRRIGAEKNALLTDIVRDEEQKLQFLPGYIAGKEENFNGKLRGLIFNYEFVRAGKPMSGRFYFCDPATQAFMSCVSQDAKIICERYKIKPIR